MGSPMARKKNFTLNGRRNTAIALICAYGITVAVRFLLALATSAYPTVLIDEILYYGMARSIATQGEMLYMGQLANYSYVLYPLVLSPIYLLFGDGAQYYRLLQLWNIMLMTLSIFPVFALAKAIGKDARKAMIVTLLTLLLPDMLLGEKVMSESLVYPLTYTLLLFLWRYIEHHGWKAMLGIGAMGGLLYSVKPGQAALAAVVIVCAFVSAIRLKNAKRALHAVLGLGAMIAAAALLYLLGVCAFGMHSSIFSVYDQQINSQQGLQLGAFARGAALSPYYLIVGGGVLAMLVPLYRYKSYEPNQKSFLNVVLLTIAVLMLCTAWVVNRVEIADPTIHTRYFAMYIPIFALFSCLFEDEKTIGVKAKKKSDLPANARNPLLPILIIAAYMLLCTVIFGCLGGINQNATIISNLIVSVLYTGASAGTANILFGVVVAAAVLCAVLALKNAKARTCGQIALYALAAMFVVNNIAGYANYASATYDEWIADNKETAAQIGDREYLYVYGTNRRFYNAYMDGNSRNTTAMVFINDLYNNMLASDGVYVPFVPDTTRGMIPDRETPDTTLLVLDTLAYHQVELAADATLVNASANGNLYTVSIPAGKRWVDSMLGGVVEEKLTQGAKAGIYLFGEKATKAVTLSLDVELPQATDFILSYGSEKYSFALPAGRDTYTLTLNAPTNFCGLSFSGCDANIYGYSIK